MCGIIFSANFEKKKEETSNEWIINQYQDQINRGSQGFGAVFIQPDGTYKVTKACEQTKILMDLYHKENQTPIILMHHRFPTSSENKMIEAHPIEVNNGLLKHKYLMVHNGIINSANETKKKHEEELGFVYTTQRKRNNLYDEFNDSECLAIELARLIEKQDNKININGSMAFIMLQIDKKENKITKMFFGHNNGAPLKMSKTQNKLRLSSEGEGNDVEELYLYSCNLTDFKLKKEKLTIIKEDWSVVKKTYPTVDNSTINDKTQIITPQKPSKESLEELSEELTSIEELFEKINEYKEDKDITIEGIIEQHKENINTTLEALKGELIRYDDIIMIDDTTYKNNVEKEIEKIIETTEVVIDNYNNSMNNLKITASQIYKNNQFSLINDKQKELPINNITQIQTNKIENETENTKAMENAMEDIINEPYGHIRGIHSQPFDNPINPKKMGF